MLLGSGNFYFQLFKRIRLQSLPLIRHISRLRTQGHEHCIGAKKKYLRVAFSQLHFRSSFDRTSLSIFVQNPRRSFSAKSSLKSKICYTCSECGHQQFKWTGKCNGCGEWNSLLEDSYIHNGSKSASNDRDKYSNAWVTSPHSNPSSINSSNTSSSELELDTLLEIQTNPTGWNQRKLKVSDEELSRVLGGGLTAGSLTLLAGSPGVGKSTLALQLAMSLGVQEADEEQEPGASKMVLYMSGEESAAQVKQRAERLSAFTDARDIDSSVNDIESCGNAVEIAPTSTTATSVNKDVANMPMEAPELKFVSVLCDSNLETLLDHLSSPRIRQNMYRAIIVDSIQVMTLPHENSQAGSVVQVKSCATQLLRYAKQTGVPIIMVGHITKSGEVAGPRVLEHLVDVVLYLEGDPNSDQRWLRSKKNRFGPNEVGIFEMGNRGLHGVLNPSEMFVSSLGVNQNQNNNLGEGRATGLPNGVAWTITTEESGSTRAFAAEIQALSHVTAHESMAPRSRCTGIHQDRVQLMLAVLSIHANMKHLRSQDTFVNVVGGLRLEETGADLAVAMALASTFYEKQIQVGENGTPYVFIGEVGLGGEIRTVKQIMNRLSVAARLGIKVVFIPAKLKNVDFSEFENNQGMTIVKVATVQESIELGLGLDGIGNASIKRKEIQKANKAESFPKMQKKITTTAKLSNDDNLNSSDDAEDEAAARMSNPNEVKGEHKMNSSPKSLKENSKTIPLRKTNAKPFRFEYSSMWKSDERPEAKYVVSTKGPNKNEQTKSSETTTQDKYPSDPYLSKIFDMEQ